MKKSYIVLIFVVISGIVSWYISFSKEQSIFKVFPKNLHLPSAIAPANHIKTMDSPLNTEEFFIEGDQIKKTKASLSKKIIYPNSEWIDKTKIINGKIVTYRFGEGNPPEVALSEQEIVKMRRAGKLLDYMHPKAEIALKKVLDDPFFAYLLDKYYQEIYEQNPDTIPVVPMNWSMEHLLTIDPNTGRKIFHPDFYAIESIFTTLDSPLVEETAQPWKKYLTENEYKQMKGMQEAITPIYSEYLPPEGSFGMKLMNEPTERLETTGVKP